MKTLYLRDFTGTVDEPAYHLYRALTAAREQKADRLVIDPGVYEINETWCVERYLAYSNHDYNGPKRLAALIEDMEDFEIDGGGATFVCHGLVTPIGILRSRNIRVHDLTLENPDTMFWQVKVTGHGEGYVDVARMYGGDSIRLERGKLGANYKGHARFPMSTNIEFNGQSGEIEPGTADQTLGVDLNDLQYEMLADGTLRIHGVKRYPPLGNVLILSATRRLGAGVYCLESQNVTLENITIHSCYGMGLLAQMSEDITLRHFCTQRKGDCWYTACADATHFVNCTGTVRVEDCLFEGQLDDALNIHGMYTRIVGRGERELLVQEMHEQAKDIRIYRPGDRVQALRPDPLLPYAWKTVREVEYISGDIIRILTEEPVEDIAVGDDLENITRAADLVFARNVVRNNRARGMLIATPGKVLLEDCYFHASGTAVKFESDGAYWYESGATTDVTIRACHFDRCVHGRWGTAPVQCAPRKTTEEGKYYHGTIRVQGCTFTLFGEEIARMDNVAHFVFTGNRITPAEGKEALLLLHHVGEAEVQPDQPITTY